MHESEYHWLEPSERSQRPSAGSGQRSLVADEVDGAAHVDIHKVDVQVLIQQLRAAPHGICIAPTHLHTALSRRLQMFPPIQSLALCLQHRSMGLKIQSAAQGS